MMLGDLLVAHGLVTQDQIDAAIENQKVKGGRLGDSLISMGLVTEEQLNSVLHKTPKAPESIEDLGISRGSLLSLVLKVIYVTGEQSASRIAGHVKLPPSVIETVIDDAIQKRLLEKAGLSGAGLIADYVLNLTNEGRSWAAEAHEKNQYVGPAPVSLGAYCDQIVRQRITAERISPELVAESLSDMVVPDSFVRVLGPAINAGRSMLLYGPPGNGKTMVAVKVANIFRDVIFIPYCVEIEGQILKVFDPTIHVEATRDGRKMSGPQLLLRETFDQRWVACERPMVMAGGELTLEMLDLSYDPISKFYEAPLHIKALNGTFVIDDFGRQLVTPSELLNRWIVPLESKVDYLKLHSGKSFEIPFDELVVFSTNLSPKDLVDPAFLRRIPYKLDVVGPDLENFLRVLKMVSKNAGIDLTEDDIAFLLEEMEREELTLAYFQGKFIMDQIIASCKFEDNIPPKFDRQYVRDAVANLSVKEKSPDASAP